MTSGDLFTVYPVASNALNNPPAAPGALIKKFVEVVTAPTANFFINAPGAAGGLFNAFDATGYTVNKSPDVIVKAAADPGFGHYELLGIISTFRNRIFPCSVVGTTAKDNPLPTPQPLPVTCPVDGSTAPSALGAFDDTRVGGGLGVSGRWPLFNKKLDFGVKGVAGGGLRPCGLGQRPERRWRARGTAALITTRPGTLVFDIATGCDHD